MRFSSTLRITIGPFSHDLQQVQCAEEMSQCKKFAPNIFHKTKCSNCFRQKEEHSAEALECNRASRSIARSGYLFVAPDWDFSVPLNRTKRWQRRWFVLYDDGELNYSVDEHPDTVPQGSVDMSKVLEVTGAEQVTGHPHSLALTSPDRVTFVKAASREDARWWAELLAVFPRRHKRNATFPGGRASPSLPQLGRSASPQPPRPRHLSVSGPSPRTNFETPPLKEERESPPKDANARSATWMPERTGSVLIENVQQTNPVRNDYIVSSGSPPTRDKLRCDDKARVRRDWRNERLRDIATALTDRSPESSLALPSEGLLHLKKGWLFLKNAESEWARRWIVLCGPSLNVYQDQDEQTTPELIVELSTVTNYFSEIATNDSKYGFEIQYSGQKKLILSALTQGIRSNWLQALKKAALPNNINNNNNNTINSAAESPTTPSTPRSVLLSSDEEYRTASEGGRRGSEDWSELPPSPPLTRLALNRVKDRSRLRPRLPRCQSRQSTLDSTSTDELDCAKDAENFEMQHNSINNKNHGVIVGEVEELQKQWAKALSEIQHLQDEIARLNKIQSEAVNREKNAKEMLELLERNEKELNQRNVQMENKYKKEQKAIQRRLLECEELAKSWENKCNILSRELQTKQRIIGNLQDDLTSSNERLTHTRLDNDKLYKRVQELEGKYCYKNNNIHLDSLTDLTNIDLDLDIDELGQNELKEYCLDLKCRFEKAVLEIRAVKRELRDSHELCDHLELAKFTLTHSIELTRSENQAEIKLFVDRLDNLTAKLSAAEKQLKSKSGKSDKRRSLSLKGRENFSINKEVEDKVTELEAKILALERGGRTTKKKYSSKSRERSSERGSPIDDKSLRRLRRKSLDSATSSEPMKLLMRLSTLETKVSNSVNASNESLNVDATRARDDLIAAARIKINECLQHVNAIKRNVSLDKLSQLEQSLSELNDILKSDFSSTGEYEVINSSASGVVKQLQQLLLAKLTDLNEKKRLLQEKNEYDASAKLEMLAEKLAFENVLINRIQNAFGAPSGDRLVCKEVKETAHLIVGLQNKFNGKQSTALVCKTSADYLSKILAQYLIASARGLTVSASAKPQVNSSDLNLLRDEQRKLHNLYNNYKATKLPQIAEALATETIHLSADQTCRISVRSIGQQLSNATRDLVNAELIQSEINHILIRAAQIYQSNFDQDHTYFFTFFASERAALELWSDSVGDYLYDETNRAIGELSDLYQSALTKLQRQNFRRRVESERNSRSPSNLLHDFADIVAHKALIDARIHVLSGDSSSSSSSAMTSLADLLSENRDGSQLAVEINQSLEAEFACMLDRFNVECLRQICQPEFDEILHSLDEIATKVGDLQRCVDLPQLGDEDDTSPKCWRDVCRTCRSLRDKLEEIRSAFYKRFDNFDEHQQRPVYLGTEYLTQVENLRAAYRCALASCKERHQETDIEQLQMLCERVLSSMEQWHRRTIQDLREAHAQEMEALKMDKEQALEEETQATLAALDAMRKAHEAEVQREVSRFKQEFARQQRDEILDLSERLSVKRLEAAALEEQLGNATRQLTHAQQHILQLERNP